MKAADISDEQIHALIAQAPPGYVGQTLWAIQEALPQFPAKVVRAKLRSMIKRGVIDGCAYVTKTATFVRIPE